MAQAKEILDQQFLEMRWRMLSLAADFDRIERAVGGAQTLAGDTRAKLLREGLAIVLSELPGRAERFQNLFSDQTPPPK